MNSHGVTSPTHQATDAAVLITNPDRSRSDRCPGALRLHEAADGKIGRIRFPGGHVTAEQWREIANIANTLGDGNIHITTRGNMQFRGVQDDAAFSEMVQEAGFLPSIAHDKIRNILASPLSPALLPFVQATDRALLADAQAAQLSGRTLFGFDAGTGDIAAKHPDFGVIFHHPTASVASHLNPTDAEQAFLILGGKITDVAIEPTVPAVTEVLVHAATQWQEYRSKQWRTHEAPEFLAETVATLPTIFEHCATQQLPASLRALNPHTAKHQPIGWLEQSTEDGPRVSLGAGLRFGFLSSEVAQLLHAIGADTSITPWASLVIHDLDEGDAEAVVKVLAPRGLIFDANSPWLRVSACTGLPGCTKSYSATQADAAAFLASGEVPEGQVHFSGCERRCGHPLGKHLEYLAIGDGEYEVTQR